MARKTVARRGGHSCDLLWAAARRRQDFTYREIAEATGANLRTVQKIFGGWVKAGVLTYSVGKRGQHFYRIVHDSAQTPCCPPRVTDALWIAMKMNKVFTAAELTSFACNAGVQVSPGTAQSYCRNLARVGYLVLVQRGVGKHKTSNSYRFVGPPGPRAPMVMSDKNIFDFNRGEIVKPIKEKNNDQH